MVFVVHLVVMCFRDLTDSGGVNTTYLFYILIRCIMLGMGAWADIVVCHMHALYDSGCGQCDARWSELIAWLTQERHGD